MQLLFSSCTVPSAPSNPPRLNFYCQCNCVWIPLIHIAEDSQQNLLFSWKKCLWEPWIFNMCAHVCTCACASNCWSNTHSRFHFAAISHNYDPFIHQIKLYNSTKNTSTYYTVIIPKKHSTYAIVFLLEILVFTVKGLGTLFLRNNALQNMTYSEHMSMLMSYIILKTDQTSLSWGSHRFSLQKQLFPETTAGQN